MKAGGTFPTAVFLVAVTALAAGAQTPVEVYGNLNLTVTRDSGLAAPNSPNPEETRNLFEFSLRTTQVGLRWNPIPVAEWQGSGRIEFDLQGGQPNTLQPRVRHAFLNLSLAGWEILIGQTWDVIAPLRADSVSFPAESWPGDIGQRRPLICGTWRTRAGTEGPLAFLLAVGQFTQGLEHPATGLVVETTHVPALMGRVTMDFPLMGEKAQVSLWGHSGRKGYGAHGTLPAGAIQTSSAGTSLLLPLGPRWSFKTELWQGRVGDAAYEGDLARASLSLADVVQSRGGWGQFTFRPSLAWRLNAGLGRQYPRTIKTADQGALRISSWYANGYWLLAKRFEVGLECSDWDSRFPGTTKSNKTLRTQISMTLRF